MNTLPSSLKSRYRRLVRPRDKYAFLCRLAPAARILDVGCGNNAPFLTKAVVPDCHYTGIDVGDYNQTQPNLADDYIVTSPEGFAAEIGKFKGCFDAVVSTHNLEHCNDRQATLEAMLGALRPSGRLFMSFPCERSIGFPSRAGCLNYFDDPTHVGKPPEFARVIQTINSGNCEIEFASPGYRPALDCVVGALNEPRSRRLGRILKGTWAYYGFETIVWATKKAS